MVRKRAALTKGNFTLLFSIMPMCSMIVDSPCRCEIGEPDVAHGARAHHYHTVSYTGPTHEGNRAFRLAEFEPSMNAHTNIRYLYMIKAFQKNVHQNTYRYRMKDVDIGK